MLDCCPMMEDDMNPTRADEAAPQKDRPAEAPTVEPLRRAPAPERPAKSRAMESVLEAGRAAKNSAAGFQAVSEELERRSREWTKMVRLLDLNRQNLDAAEAERDAAYAELSMIVPIVEQTARELKAAMEAGRAGEQSPDLATLFSTNGEALDRLERVSVALTGHFLRCRSAWEQYVRSVYSAQQLRAEAQASVP
jgi:hypothetical protein